MYICSIKSIIIIIIETLACLSPGLPQHADQRQLLAHLWLSSICVHEYIWRNVWTSDKRWEPGTLSHSHTLSLCHSLIQSLSTCWTTFVLMSMLKVTLSLSHSITLDMLNNFCFHVYPQNPLSQFHTLNRTQSLSHSLTLSISHSLSLDMRDNSCFHVKGLFNQIHYSA